MNHDLAAFESLCASIPGFVAGGIVALSSYEVMAVRRSDEWEDDGSAEAALAYAALAYARASEASKLIDAEDPKHIRFSTSDGLSCSVRIDDDWLMTIVSEAADYGGFVLWKMQRAARLIREAAAD